MANFIDKVTGEKFQINNFSFSIKNGVEIFLEKGKQIKNPKTGNILEHIPLPENEQGVGIFLKSNNKETLNKMLAKRSHNHFKKEIEEVKRDMNKQLEI